MKPTRLLAAAGFVLLTTSLPRAAETRASLEFWGQAVRGDTSSSKFEEYREVPRGAFVERFGLETSAGACYLRLRGSKPGLADQRFDLESGRWGIHRVAAYYDQIPHVYSNTAQTFLKDAGNGLYTLPDNMQSSLQASVGNSSAFLSGSPFVPLRVDRKAASVSYAYSPAGRWRMNLGYSGEKREGHKAIGVAYGHGQVQEALEPVDYQTHNVKLGGEYAGKDFGFSAGYQYSRFENGIKALTVDNPYKLGDGALSGTGVSAPGAARLALPPNNQTHQGDLAFTAKLPAKSRLSASVTYAVQSQDDPFLPLTVNTVILASPALPKPPAQTLNGEAHTLNATARWNWKPWDNVSLDLNGRRYNVDNRTPSLLFQQYVQYDTNMSPTQPTRASNPTRSRVSLPIDYNKTNLGADLYYSIVKPLSLKLAYDWERMARSFRESEETKENLYTASFKAGPFWGLVLRPSFQYATKAERGYSAERVAEETFPLGEGTSLGQIEELRKPDEAGRKRQKAVVRAEWDLNETLNAGLDYGLVRDYYAAEYGTLDAETVNYSVDIGVNPTERLGLYADYTWERMTTNTRSRYRTTAVDLPANDWNGRLEDTVHTVNVGATCVLVEQKLDLDLEGSGSFAKGVQQASNPNTITTASALAIDLPNTYNRRHKVEATLRYRWLDNLTAKLRYGFERYTETDWAQDDLNVYQPNWNKSVFLGATQGHYEAHLVSLGLSYVF